MFSGHQFGNLPVAQLSQLRVAVVQGSHDGSEWVDLRRHIDAKTIRLPGQYASWPVAGHAATIPWQMFRVIMLEANASPNTASRNNLALSFIEFYGYLSIAKSSEASVSEESDTSSSISCTSIF